jgi:hypothetical protein
MIALATAAALAASGAVVALWALLAACLPRAVAAVPRARTVTSPQPPPPGEPLVSVIVPARDEERLLGRCLASLAAQQYPALEVVVVDDHSSDRTRAVAESSGVARVVAAPDRPDGWTGKCWAAWQGARVARGEWLLFLDADAVLAPTCLRAALAAAGDADLLTLLPRARCATVLEAIVQPVLLMLLLWRDDPRRLNDPREPAAAAPGAFLCFRRASYYRIGGHVAVRAELVEDRKLAERLKQWRLRLRVVAAPQQIETSRPIAARDLWRGWSRVIPDGLGRSAGAAALAAGAVQTMFLLPYLLAPAGGWLAALAALHLGLTLVVRAQLRAAYGVDHRLALLQPLGALFAMAVLLRALLPGRVRWRSREYAR